MRALDGRRRRTASSVRIVESVRLAVEWVVLGMGWHRPGEWIRVLLLPGPLWWLTEWLTDWLNG